MDNITISTEEYAALIKESAKLEILRAAFKGKKYDSDFIYLFAVTNGLEMKNDE